MITYPTPTVSFVRWAAALRQTRPDIEINPIILKEDGWKEWVNKMIQSTVCQTNNCPRSDSFENWRVWASEFIRSFGQNV